MGTYGQFCSVAKALEVVGERWTPLVLRELMCGSSRFNEIQRGIPRISPSLLAKRLKSLEAAGVITRTGETGAYALTQAGRELRPMIEQLGVWGNRWVRGHLGEDDLDPDLLMWDIRRRIALEKLPPDRICLCFEFAGPPGGNRTYWLAGSREGVELCVTDPGIDVALYILTDVRTLTLVWNGDCDLAARIDDGSIELHGPRRYRQAFPGWLRLGMFAKVKPATPGVA